MIRFGEPKAKTQKYVTRPGAYAIIKSGSDLLLTLQDADDLELQLPGGGIDEGETPLKALHREILEETGFRTKNAVRVGAYQRYTYMSEYSMWAHKICHIYFCFSALQISEPLESEHTNIWMSPRDAEHYLTNTGDKHFVSKLIKAGYI